MSMTLFKFTTDPRTISQILAAGYISELSHLDADAQLAARTLEAELLADAAAGVDVRIRLIGEAVSASEV
jgi:hypothetical protein